MLIYEGNQHKNKGAISQLGAEKITFPPKPDRQTDICFYRVALLLKTDLVEDFTLGVFTYFHAYYNLYYTRKFFF